MDINELKNINNDGSNKEHIIKQIKEYCNKFYGKFTVSQGEIIENGQLVKYEKQYKDYLNKMKLDFRKFFEHNVPNFEIYNEGNKIIAIGNDKNKAILDTDSPELIMLSIDISTETKKFNKIYEIEIKSNFKKPSRQNFEMKKIKSGWRKIIRYKRFTLEELDNLTVSDLNSALNEIKEVVEYNNKIEDDIKFHMDIYKEKNYDKCLFSSQSIEQVIQQIIKAI